MLKKYTKLKKLIDGFFLFLVFSTVFVSTSRNAYAIPGKDVGVDTMTNFHNIMQQLKSFTLDKIATMIAKQILHQLIMSVVNWINSGFSGSPAFLTNPKGFFLNAADQIAAEFISTGPLNVLCSPFALNIKLNLASGQVNNDDYQNKYKCSVTKIIQNVNRGFSVSANVVTTPNGTTINDILTGNILSHSDQLSVNGNSVQGLINAAASSTDGAKDKTDAFLGGDFNAGGFPAFVAMFSESQNTPTGAYLMAQSDLALLQAQKKNSISNDLDRSGGFMSWQNCKTIPTGSNNVPNKNSKIVYKPNKTGGMDTQECTTETPGSVIK